MEKQSDNTIFMENVERGIKEKLGLITLEYADVEIFEKAIGLSREELCLECWGCGV